MIPVSFGSVAALAGLAHVTSGWRAAGTVWLIGLPVALAVAAFALSAAERRFGVPHAPWFTVVTTALIFVGAHVASYAGARLGWPFLAQEGGLVVVAGAFAAFAVLQHDRVQAVMSVVIAGAALLAFATRTPLVEHAGLVSAFALQAVALRRLATRS